MIKVTYDREIDAKYVSIRVGKVHETKTLTDWLFVDVDSDNNVLGVEILDSSKNDVTISTIENHLAQIDVLSKKDKGPLISKERDIPAEYVTSMSAVVAA